MIRWLIRNLEKIAGGLNVSGAGGAGGSAAGAVQSDLGCYQVCFEGGMDQKLSMFGFDSTKICLKVHIPFFSSCCLIHCFFQCFSCFFLNIVFPESVAKGSF